MNELSRTDHATAEASPSRQQLDANLQPLLDLVARLLAEEFRASMAPALGETATQDE